MIKINSASSRDIAMMSYWVFMLFLAEKGLYANNFLHPWFCFFAIAAGTSVLTVAIMIAIYNQKDKKYIEEYIMIKQKFLEELKKYEDMNAKRK